MRHHVLYQGVVVHALHLVGNDTTVQYSLGILSCHLHTACIAGMTIEESQHGVAHRAVPTLSYEYIAIACAHQVGLLYLVKVQVTIVGAICLYYLVGEELLVVDGMVGDDDVGLRTLLHDDEHTAVGHRVLLALQHIVYLNGMLGASVAGNIYQQGIYGKHRIQRHDGIRLVCYIILIWCNVQGSLLNGTAEFRTLGGDGRKLYAIVGSKVLGNIGILISFYLLGGKTLGGEDTEGLFPMGIHHRA